MTSRPTPTELVLPPPADPAGDARRELAQQLAGEAQATGVRLVGPDRLSADVSRRVLETGLCAMTDRGLPRAL